MGAFETLWSGVQPLLDDHFGEMFSFEPQAKADPNGRSSADASRPPTVFVGIWTDLHVVQSPANRTGHPKGEGDRFSDDRPSIDFTTAAIPYPVRIGDVVVRVSNGDRRAVSDVGSDGFTRSSMKLTGRGA